MLKYSKIKLNWRIQITVQNPVVFGARPPLNVLAPGISMASVQNTQHFKKTKWPPRKFEHFTASVTLGKHISPHSTVATFTSTSTAICNFSLASPKVKLWAKFDEVAALYWLDFRSGRSILIVECEQLQLLTGKKDANLRPVAQRTLELFARELVSIYEVKIPAR